MRIDCQIKRSLNSSAQFQHVPSSTATRQPDKLLQTLSAQGGSKSGAQTRPQSCPVVNLHNAPIVFIPFLLNIFHFFLKWPWITLSRYFSSQRCKKTLYLAPQLARVYRHCAIWYIITFLPYSLVIPVSIEHQAVHSFIFFSVHRHKIAFLAYVSYPILRHLSRWYAWSTSVRITVSQPITYNVNNFGTKIRHLVVNY